MTTHSYGFIQLASPEVLNTVASGNQSDPAVVATSGGAAIVFFDDGNTIAARRLDPDGTPTGPQVTVSAGTGAAEPEATLLSNGNVVVTWQDGTDPTQVLGRIYSADLTPVTGILTFEAGTKSFEQPDIAATADGGFIVVSTLVYGASDADIYIRKFDASGALQDSTFFSPGSTLDEDPSVAVLANGNVAVAWERHVGSDTQVWYAVYSPTLDTVQAPILLDSSGSTNHDVDVAARPDGTFTISYADNLGGGATNITTYLMDGTTGAAIDYRVTAAATGPNENVSVASSIDGYQVIVSDDRTDPAGWDLAGSFLTPDGQVVAIDTTLHGGEGFQWLAGATWIDSSTVQLAYTTMGSDSANDGMGYTLAVSRLGIVHIQNGDGTSETVHGDGLIDVIASQGGNDLLFGRDGNDLLYGGDGGDRLYGGFGADYHEGGDGPGVDLASYDDADYGDLVISLLAPEANTGAAAGDTYVGIEGVAGGVGDDKITGNGARNYLYGRGGEDSLRGGGGNDYLSGGAGEDHLYGGLGQDQHLGGTGFDYAHYNDGVYGNLVINLANGSLNAGAAAVGDTYNSIEGVVGGSANDTITGNNAANILYGLGGTDKIDGLLGNDTLIGGAGERDDYRFTTNVGAGNFDTITGFEEGLDNVVLSRAIFQGIGATLDAGEFGTSAGKDVLIIFNQSNGRLFYDEGGSDEGAGPVAFATVGAGVTLDLNDFLMIA